jgi:hypothetical protein
VRVAYKSLIHLLNQPPCNPCRKFAVDHENVRGAWISSYQGSKDFVLGRTGFSNDEKTKYAVVERRNVADVDVSGTIFQQKVGSIEFPGTTGIDGYVVGLTVESVWTDGTDGLWCIGTGLSLGTKQAKVEVKSEGSRGMHVGLTLVLIGAGSPSILDSGSSTPIIFRPRSTMSKTRWLAL